MKTKSISKLKDKLLDCDYELIQVNAKELSETIKDYLSDKKINPKEYNSFNEKDHHWGDEKFEEKNISNPPISIYEYQNFFLLDMGNGNITLLDGFRRLIWYNTPDIDILVKVYKKSDLSDKQILTLMVDLNNFKFYSNSDYHDRGFALFMKSIFNVEIKKFLTAFEGYLNSDDIKNGYSWDTKQKTEELLSVKDRIINDNFIEDMRFLQELKSQGCMVNRFLGALLYKRKTENPLIKYTVDEFMKLHKESQVLPKLLERYSKVGTTTGAESGKVVNQIIEIYNNFFDQMEGKEIKKSYAELKEECKKITTELSKDKSYIKITPQNRWMMSMFLECAFKYKKQDNLGVKCVIYPLDDEPKALCGLFDVKFVKFRKRELSFHSDFYTIELPDKTLCETNNDDFRKFELKSEFKNNGFPYRYQMDMYIKVPRKMIEEWESNKRNESIFKQYF